MKNDTITYAPQLTTEIQPFWDLYIACIFSSTFKNSLRNVLIFLCTARFSFYFPVSIDLLLFLRTRFISAQNTGIKKLWDVQTNFTQVWTVGLKLRAPRNITLHMNDLIFLNFLTLLCFCVLLQLVRRSYISRRGGESAQTQGVWGLPGQREWERPRGVLNVRQVGRKEWLRHPHHAHF